MNMINSFLNKLNPMGNYRIVPFLRTCRIFHYIPLKVFLFHLQCICNVFLYNHKTQNLQ